MVLRKLAVALLSVGVMLPGLSHALTVGPGIDVMSSLSQPFHGRIALSDLGDLAVDDIHVNLATPNDFERMGIEKVYFLQDLHFNVVINPGGDSYIDVTTARPVVEPVLDFVLHVSWPNNDKLNDIVALLDPPQTTAPVTVSAPSATGATPAPALPAAAPVPAAPTETSSAPAMVSPRPHHGRRPRTPEDVQSGSTASTSGASTYRIRSADTLWKVAQKLRPSDAVTVPQTMIALQHNNPDAFADHNINLLKRGEVLHVPTEAQIRDVSAEQAIASVREQNQSWRGMSSQGKGKLEGQQLDATSKAGTSHKLAGGSTKAEMKLSAAEGASSSSVAGAGSTSKPLSQSDLQKLNANQAKASTFKEENAQLGSKVGALDSQVKSTDKQLAVDNAKLAQLQSQLKANADKAAAVQAAVPQAAAASGAVAATSGIAASGTAMQPAHSAPKLAAVPEKISEAPASAPSSSDDNSGMLEIIYAIAGLIVLGLIAFLWNKIFKKSPQAPKTLSGGSGAGGRPTAPPAPPVPVAPSQGGLGNLEPSGDTREVPIFRDPAAADPLEEVEQYLAFERYPQAVGFLVKAIAGTPDRADLRLKLMEVYVKLKDNNGFDEQEAALVDSTDLGVLARIEELRTQLPPRPREASKEDGIDYHPSKAKPLDADNEMPSLEELEMDFNATVSASHPNLKALDDSQLAPKAPVVPATPAATTHEELDFSLGESALGDDLDFELAHEETVKAAPAALDDLNFSLDEADLTQQRPAHGDHGLGGGLSLGDASDLADLELTPEVAAPAAPKPVEDDLSFSLDDLDVDSPAPAATAPQPVAEVLPPDDFGLDDLSYEEPVPAPAHEDLSFDHDAHDALEGDFSLDEAALTTADADEVKLDHVMAESDLNDRAADFDMDLAEHASRADLAPLPEVLAPAPADDGGFGIDDEFDFLADADENATKLDLARAYIDMGDLEGAKDILNEVVTEGNTAQQEEAKGLLTQVG